MISPFGIEHAELISKHKYDPKTGKKLDRRTEGHKAALAVGAGGTATALHGTKQAWNGAFKGVMAADRGDDAGEMAGRDLMRRGVRTGGIGGRIALLGGGTAVYLNHKRYQKARGRKK